MIIIILNCLIVFWEMIQLGLSCYNHKFTLNMAMETFHKTTKKMDKVSLIKSNNMAFSRQKKIVMLISIDVDSFSKYFANRIYYISCTLLYEFFISRMYRQQILYQNSSASIYLKYSSMKILFMTHK